MGFAQGESQNPTVRPSPGPSCWRRRGTPHSGRQLAPADWREWASRL